MTTPVYIVSATRTPIAAFLGTFSDLSAAELGAVAIQAALERAGFPAEKLDEVLMGNVISAGQGQAPARQAMIKAGIPVSVGATTINKVCGSGLKAITLAATTIQAGLANTFIAGGMESMSQVPYYVQRARMGFRMGHQQLIDGMIHDGLWDPYNNFHMGSAGELCASKYHFSREAQDEYAATSYRRAIAAIESGAFKAEIAPVSVPQGKKPPIELSQDEQPYKDNIDKLPSLRAAFQKENGTITAGNASSINDGAAALLVVSEAALKTYQLQPIAKIHGFATHSQEPEWFTTAPVGAIQKLCQQQGITPADIDLFEINEAFSVVAMAAMQELNIPHEKLNVNGGAVALGHPIGASGARIVVTLIHALRAAGKTRGIVGICNGGGEAVAMLVETV
ncbi:MAG: acetyl-CoA C-acyltransferase [Cyanobacteria bacterium]|nr:acetyl-CoA C-acyltransferase [Cyanobacteriota bacterium]